MVKSVADTRMIIELETTMEEKDLGIIIDQSLKFEHHIDISVKKANKIMGLIRRTFNCLDPSTFRALFTALVRPIVEYGHAVWNPYHKGAIRKIESVQRNATKMVNGLKDTPYIDRLRTINLPTLRFRRMRGDMIETYKIINGLYDRTSAPVLDRAQRSSRGHQFKLFQRRTNRLDIRKNFFTNRIVGLWNALPTEVVNANSLNSFKNRLDKSWRNHPMKFDVEYDAEISD